MLKVFRCLKLGTWLCLSLCVGLAQAETVRDDRQQEVTLSKPPQRIVSLLPSLTETVCALGQCHRLVGLDRYSNWPPAVRQLPRLGGGLDPNIESVVAQRPDLVLMATSARGAERLQALGITVLVLEPRTHADLQRVITTLAQALGVPAHEGERLWREINAGVLAAAQSLPQQAKAQKQHARAAHRNHAPCKKRMICHSFKAPAAHRPAPCTASPGFAVPPVAR